jgi:hypothetical protein
VEASRSASAGEAFPRDQFKVRSEALTVNGVTAI